MPVIMIIISVAGVAGVIFLLTKPEVRNILKKIIVTAFNIIGEIIKQIKTRQGL